MPGGRADSLSDVAARLARRWATQRLAAVQTYGRILADYGEGRSSGRAAVGALVKLAAEEAVRYPSDAIGIATDYAAAAARRAGLDLEAAGLGSERRRGAAASPVRDLEISGPMEGDARTEFFLDNPHDIAAEVSFHASPFTSALGETGSRPILHPAQFVLAPGEERAVRVTVTLAADEFEVGHRYTANVAILGFDEMVVRVRLTVLKPD